MAYEVKDNTFSAFVNDKGGNDKRPDWSGKGKIDGKEVRVSIWKRTSASGVEYLSGSVTEITEKNSATGAEKKEEPKEDLNDSEFPF